MLLWRQHHLRSAEVPIEHGEAFVLAGRAVSRDRQALDPLLVESNVAQLFAEQHQRKVVLIPFSNLCSFWQFSHSVGHHGKSLSPCLKSLLTPIPSGRPAEKSIAQATPKAPT